MNQEDPPEIPSQQASRERLLMPALLGCLAFLYLEAFVLPFTPRAATGDQSIYLHNAARMLEGQLIYRDYDHFTLPGTDVLYFILFRVFGVRAWIPQAMLVLVGLLIAWLSFRICRKLVRGPAVYLPGFLFLVLPFTGYFDATHHWYSTLAAMSALAIVIENRTEARLVWAGALWGVGTCFAQSQIMGLIGLGLFVVWEQRRRKEPVALLLRKEAALLGSYIAVVAAFSAYFVWKVGFHQFIYYTIVFVAKYYPADYANSWRAYMSWRPTLHSRTSWLELPTWSLIHLIVPLTYVLFFERYRRESGTNLALPWERLMLVNIVGLSTLLTVASAATYSRLYTVSLPALILLVWFLDSHLRLERILLGALWATVALLAVLKPMATQTRPRTVLDLPTGRTAFFDVPLKSKWLLERTCPGDYFFGDQFVGYALNLRNPSRVPFVRATDYTRPEEVSNLVQGLDRHQVRFVSWYADLDNEPVDPAGDHLGPLRQYLREHYQVAQAFPNGDQIWQRSN